MQPRYPLEPGRRKIKGHFRAVCFSDALGLCRSESIRELGGGYTSALEWVAKVVDASSFAQSAELELARAQRQCRLAAYRKAGVI